MVTWMQYSRLFINLGELKMIKKNLLILFTVLSALALGACGGSSGGGGGGGGGGLGTGTFEKEIAPLALSGWGLFANFTIRAQLLYNASEVNGAGYVTALKLRAGANSPSITCPETTIKMGHTSLSPLTNTFASNVEEGRGTLATVRALSTLTLPAVTMGDYATITLDTPFYYNGVDNLVVDVVHTMACSASFPDEYSNGLPAGSSTWSMTTANATGNAITSRPNATLVFAGGDDDISPIGTLTGNTYPFSTDTPHTQNLYLASEVNGSGPVTGVAFQMNNTSVAGTYTATVMMGHSTLATLGTTFAANFDTGAPVTVANAITFDIPAGIPAGEWFWVPLPDSTFTYNGTDNLIVDVVTTAATSSNSLIEASVAGRRLWSADNIALTGSVSATGYQLKVRFNGGTMMLTKATASTTGIGWDTVAGRTQRLYRTAELGTGGAITKLAFRLDTDAVASDYINFNVKVDQIDPITLGVSFLGNLTGSAQTIFNGTLSVPAGALAGDWVDIPISAFTYDPTKNLLVEYSTAGGTGANIMRWNTDATLYASRGIFHLTSNINDTGTLSNGVPDIKLTLSK